MMRISTTFCCALLVLASISAVCATVLHVPSEYPTIQAGIYAATHGDTVLVAGGLYTGEGNRDIDFIGRRIVVMAESGPRPVIIDCQGDSSDPHRAFYFHSAEGRTSVVQGFVIRNGWADEGGAIYSRYSSPTIASNTIMGNFADDLGGGICCRGNSGPLIEGNGIVGNTAHRGGGIGSDDDAGPLIKGNTILDNDASHGGGIFYGLILVRGAPIKNNVIASNSGAGIKVFVGSVLIEHCTITGNSGGGLRCLEGSPTVRNSILWGDSGPEIDTCGPLQISVTYTDVEGGWPGEGNIDADPLFAPGPVGEYYLSQVAAGQLEQSPCVDAGDPDLPAPMATTRTDHICDVWLPDMGYHYPGCVVGVDDGYREDHGSPSCYLAQNHPNPFATSTTIQYSVPTSGAVRVAIFDIRGALVRTLVSEKQSIGRYQVLWDGRDRHGHRVGSGVYFSQLSVGDHAETKRMVLLR